MNNRNNISLFSRFLVFHNESSFLSFTSESLKIRNESMISKENIDLIFLLLYMGVKFRFGIDIQ